MAYDERVEELGQFSEQKTKQDYVNVGVKEQKGRTVN